MDLMPSAEELRELLLNHDFAVRQIMLLDGYIEGLSEQTFVSAIGNRLAIAFQKMIRITVAEGLKRMYKEYRLKQWQKLLDKAATLRRLLENQEDHDNTRSRQLSIENSHEVQGYPHENTDGSQQNIPESSSTDFRSHEIQHDWQRLAPEAYDWYPVTDFRNSTDSMGARSHITSPRFRISAATPMNNSTTDVQTYPQMASENVIPATEQSADHSLMDFELIATDHQDNLEQESRQEDHLLQTISVNNATVFNRLTSEVNDVVGAMQAFFQDSDDEIPTDANSEPHDLQYQGNGQQEMIHQPYSLPQPDRLESWTSDIVRHQLGMTSPTTATEAYMTMTSTPGVTNVNITSSPAGTVRVLEDMNQASILGEIISENSPARRRLLWCDDPPNPADDPPRILAIVPPAEETETNLEPTDQGLNNNEETPAVPVPGIPSESEQPEAELESSFQSYVSWESSVDSNDIDTLPGILYAAERLGPMDQTMHMDVEMGDMGLGHLLFDRAAGTWATSHCEFHRSD